MKRNSFFHEDNLFVAVHLYLLDVFSAFQESRVCFLFCGV